ncbi:MAG: zinc ribbon domain-containing protein [Candidatus Omnitrophota bacterium]
MAEENVLAKIKVLVSLQKIDHELFQLKQVLNEKPAEIAELEREFEMKKANLKALQEETKRIQVERNTLEGDLAQKEENIRKADSQLSQIKTNKEYTAKITEIEGMNADKSQIEEQILLSYDKADEITARMEKEKQKLAEEEKAFQEKKADITKEIKDLESRAAELEQQRHKFLPDVDKPLLVQYERILQNRGGLAVVAVKDNSCGGCYMNIPPQVVNEIKKHKELIVCDACERILYLEEDVAA